ncbi:MAG: DUF4360 domain-containing protein [Luteimonas sp.]
MIKQAMAMAMLVGYAGASFAQAQTIMINGVPIQITQVNTNGDGCAPGTVTATATPDGNQVAILFRDYRAVTNAVNTVAGSDCNIAIGLAVASGFSIGILGIDWRGSVVTSPGALVNFHREFFFSGTRGAVSDDSWSRPGLQNFFLQDDPAFAVFSRCDGQALIARADTSATVVGANSFFSLRSADVSARLLMTLNVRPC